MAFNNGNYFTMIFGFSGVPTTTHFATPGIGATNAAARSLIAPVACRLAGIELLADTAPGGIVIDTYTVYDDGVSTGAAATMTGAAFDGEWAGAVDVAALSLISVYFTTDGATAAREIGITLTFLIYE